MCLARRVKGLHGGNYARIGSTNEEVRSLEMVATERKKSYALGVSTVVDVLVAQQRLLKARSDQSKARYDYIRELTNLRMRAGALTMQDIAEMDGWMQRSDPAPGARKPIITGARSD